MMKIATVVIIILGIQAQFIWLTWEVTEGNKGRELLADGILKLLKRIEKLEERMDGDN